MKKILVLVVSLSVCGSSRIFAQSSLLTKATSAISTAKTASSLGLNPTALAKQIVEDNLKSKLGLTSSQTPSVTSAVTSYLTKKESILSLAKTNPTSYATKQSSLFSGLKSKLGTILLKDQMSKFMGLKSSTPATSTSVLKTLFY